jgi:uncharacterized Fe-S cluster protein YjdI
LCRKTYRSRKEKKNSTTDIKCLRKGAFLFPAVFRYFYRIMESREYTNGEITIVWTPDFCVHSGICAHGLPLVFKPGQRPWIDTQAATTEELRDQVSRCPSGALRFYMNDEPEADE